MDSLLKNGAEPNARMGRKRFTSASNNMTKSCEKFALKRAMIAALTGTRERTLSVLSKLKNIAPRAKTMLASKNASKLWWKKPKNAGSPSTKKNHSNVELISKWSVENRASLVPSNSSIASRNATLATPRTEYSCQPVVSLFPFNDHVLSRFVSLLVVSVCYGCQSCNK